MLHTERAAMYFYISIAEYWRLPVCLYMLAWLREMAEINHCKSISFSVSLCGHVSTMCI
jgi:hypothetical protein